jgi:transposase
MHKDCSLLTDAQWAQLSPLLPGQESSPGATAKDTRLFVEAVLWRARPLWGVLARFACGTVRPLAHGVRPVSALAPSRGVATGTSPGAKRDGLAPTHGQFHHRTGAPGGGRREKKDSPVGQALGCSRGGFTTKRHLSCDAYGRICALALTGGQARDCPQAPGLLARHLRPGQAVLADRAYEAGYVRTQIQQAGATAVILSKKNRLIPLDHDTEL